MLLKRSFDRLLSKGMGRQLFWLAVAVLTTMLLFLLAAKLLFKDWSFGWQDIVALYLDGGNFSGAGEHDGFRLIVALVGVLLFSTLLISVFNNIFDNISDSAKAGKSRYRVSGHVLILGSGKELGAMLKALGEKEDIAKTWVVVMTDTDVETLEQSLSTRFSGNPVLGRLILYRGSLTNADDLVSARPGKATKIYIIGEPGESYSDADNIACAQMLRPLCKNAAADIPCFLYVSRSSTVDILIQERAMLTEEGTRLKTDLINAREYAVETLLVWRWFLPVLKEEDPRFAHIVVLGTGGLAKAFAWCAAHNCHYPALDGKPRRTRITFLGKNMREWMDNLVASRPELFSRCMYSYTAPNGTQDVLGCDEEEALDIVWHFIDMPDSSPAARALLEQWSAQALDDKQDLRIACCHHTVEERTAALLHLPPGTRPIPKCIYMEEGGSLVEKVISGGNYGPVEIFGAAAPYKADPLLEHHSARGIVINALYQGEEKIGDGGITAAWYELDEAAKAQSLYCANALPFRWNCFNTSSSDRWPIYEAEARRWRMSRLLLGIPVTDDNTIRRRKGNRRIIDNMMELNENNGGYPHPDAS